MASPNNRLLDNFFIRMLLGLLLGALALSVELFFQQAVMGQNPFLFRAYIIPIVYGGLSGILLSYFYTKNQTAIKKKLRFETTQKSRYQRENEKNNKILKHLKSKLDHEIFENKNTTSALRKAKLEINKINDSSNSIGRVLIVDDEYNFLKFLQDQMFQAEFDVITATSGKEGLMKLTANNVDLVISDYKMPEMSGADFLKNVKFDFPQVSRAVMSDFEFQPSVVKILTEGLATTAFAKPQGNDVSPLTQQITRMLKMRRQLNDQKILELMESIDHLPKLPFIFNEFNDAVRREANFQMLSEIISKDAGISTKLMQIANSAFLATEKTSSLEQSIMMLGVNATRDIVLTVSLMEQGTEKKEHLDYFQKIMKHSTVVNKYMDPISKIVLGKGIDRNFKSIGLTHDIGKIMLLQHFPDRFEKIISYQFSHPNTSFYESEIALGYENCTHSEIGAYLLDLWNFPDATVEVSLFHHKPSDARDIKNVDVLKAVTITNELVNYLTRPVNIENVNFSNMFKAIRADLLKN